MTGAELIAHLVNEHAIRPHFAGADPEALHEEAHADGFTHEDHALSLPPQPDPRIPTLDRKSVV